MINVIIADDEPLALIELKTIIPWENYGFKIIGEARNGRVALELLKEHPEIDLAILDINMPTLSGLEVIEEWKRREGKTDFLIISAYSDYHLVRKAFKIGITDYILKEELEPSILIPILEKLKNSISRHNILSSKNKIPKDIENKKNILKILTENLNTQLIERYFGNIICFRLLKMEIYNFNSSDNAIKSSSVIYLTEQLLQKYYFGSIVLEFKSNYFLLIPIKESKNHNKIILDIKKEVRNTIKKFLNLTITISGGEKDILSNEINSVFTKLNNLHRFKSKGIRQAMNYIVDNYQDSTITMDILCNITGISRSHLSTLFKQETGLGYKEYLNEVRISHAINLLNTTEIMVQDVCYLVGFSNVEHFSRTFKERTGISPSKFSKYSPKI